MPLNINTSRLNDALKQMASFFMQNKLGEMSQQRQMDTYAEQDRMMRERSAAEDVAAQRGRQEQFGLDKEKAILNGLLKAGENPDIKGLGMKSETLKIAGRMAEAEAVDKELADRIESSVDAWVQTQTGKPLDRNQFRAMIMAGGLDKTLSASNEGGTNRRAAQQLPIQQSQAATSAGNLALERDKFGAEQGGPGVMGDKQRKEYIDYITDTEKYLIDQGVKGEAIGQSVRDFMGSFKYLDPMSKENRGKTLTYLGEIRLQLIQGKPPTPPQLSFLTKVRDVSAIEGGGMAPAPTGTTGVQETLKPLGLPSPKTGLYGSETVDAEAKINDNMLSLVMGTMMQRYGITEENREYAIRLAREFLAGLK